MPKICPIYVANMSQICLRYVPIIFQIFPRHVPDMSLFQIYSKYVPDMFQICPRYVWEMSQICPRYITDMCQIYPIYVFSQEKLGMTWTFPKTRVTLVSAQHCSQSVEQTNRQTNNHLNIEPEQIFLRSFAGLVYPGTSVVANVCNLQLKTYYYVTKNILNIYSFFLPFC